MPPAAADELWSLVRRPGQVDEAELWEAVRYRGTVPSGADDYRTRLLVHDALDALAGRWGPGVLEERLASLGERGRASAGYGELRSTRLAFPPSGGGW